MRRCFRPQIFASALGVTLPSYDFNLFTNGIIQAVNGDPMGLVNAIGNPIAANVGLATVAGGFELIAIGEFAPDDFDRRTESGSPLIGTSCSNGLLTTDSAVAEANSAAGGRLHQCA